MDQTAETPQHNNTEADKVNNDSSASQDDKANSSQGDDKNQSEGKTDNTGAPESYSDFTVPDGYQIPDEALSAIKEFAKASNLTQEQAQQSVDMHMKFMQQSEQAQTEAQAEALSDLKQTWINKTKADKELGGDKHDEKLAIARKALDQFGNDELINVLERSGIGHHPELIRAFYNVGQKISEDKIISGNNPTNTKPELSKTLYPHSNMN